MRRIILAFLLLPSFVIAQDQPANTVAPAYQPVREFDAKRDTAQDIAAATAEAGRTHKRVLLEIGGAWCVWCHIMDRFFEANPALTTLRDKNFVVVKINFGQRTKIRKSCPAIRSHGISIHFRLGAGWEAAEIAKDRGI